MSITALSIRNHNLIPADELVGSLTRERVALLVRYAGCHLAYEESNYAGRRWLAYVLDVHVPMDPFMAIVFLAEEARTIEDCDLTYWYDIRNTLENRDSMQQAADGTLAINIEAMTDILCAQLGVTA